MGRRSRKGGALGANQSSVKGLFPGVNAQELLRREKERVAIEEAAKKGIVMKPYDQTAAEAKQREEAFKLREREDQARADREITARADAEKQAKLAKLRAEWQAAENAKPTGHSLGWGTQTGYKGAPESFEHWLDRTGKGKQLQGGRKKSRKLGNKFNRCVKSVRSTVRARKGSTKESAAIAICTKSVLQTRGRTMKRYRKGRLITQKKFRGGGWGTCS